MPAKAGLPVRNGHEGAATVPSEAVTLNLKFESSLVKSFEPSRHAVSSRRPVRRPKNEFILPFTRPSAGSGFQQARKSDGHPNSSECKEPDELNTEPLKCRIFDTTSIRQHTQAMALVPLKTIEVFLSFAATDAAVAKELWDHLRGALSTSRYYEWRIWAFTDRLLVGEDFDAEIQKAIATADLGVFGLSSAFLNSPYIRDKELPTFLAPAADKRVIPVQLKPMSSNADLHGLQARQIFGYGDPYWSGRPPHRRETWAINLADEMHRVAQRYGLGR